MMMTIMMMNLYFTIFLLLYSRHSNIMGLKRKKVEVTFAFRGTVVRCYVPENIWFKEVQILIYNAFSFVFCFSVHGSGCEDSNLIFV